MMQPARQQPPAQQSQPLPQPQPQSLTHPQLQTHYQPAQQSHLVNHLRNVRLSDAPTTSASTSASTSSTSASTSASSSSASAASLSQQGAAFTFAPSLPPAVSYFPSEPRFAFLSLAEEETLAPAYDHAEAIELLTHFINVTIGRMKEPNEGDRRDRDDAVRLVRQAVGLLYPNATVQMYGSAANGLGTPESDSDIAVLLDPETKERVLAEGNERICQDLRKALWRCARMTLTLFVTI